MCSQRARISLQCSGQGLGRQDVGDGATISALILLGGKTVNSRTCSRVYINQTLHNLFVLHWAIAAVFREEYSRKGSGASTDCRLDSGL